MCSVFPSTLEFHRGQRLAGASLLRFFTIPRQVPCLVDTQYVVLLLGASYNKMEAENVPSAGRVGKSTPDLVELSSDVYRTVKEDPECS